MTGYRKILLAAVLAGGVHGQVSAAGDPATTAPKSSPLGNPTQPARKNQFVNEAPQSPTMSQRQKTDAPKAEKPADATVEYKVPCLTTYRDGTHGKISYLPMKFARTRSDKPLRVMIVDDTPGGSGQTIRSSVWLAAITAAMFRNDTMHGVTISVEFSGNVDGPSAGGVTCLAILSAMDGLPLPNDFAMTGTILPDGTIGVVGGVPEKMRAAAKSGVKRIFIPAFERIVKNPKGEDVDLYRLAEELKVKLYPVENIAEAYAILHDKPYDRGGYVNVRNMTKLSREVEDVLKPVYNDLLGKVSEKLKANPKLADIRIIDDYVLSPHLAQEYYQEGRLLPAALQMFRTWQALKAHEKADDFLNKFFREKCPDLSKIQYLREYHWRKLLYAMQEASGKLGKALYEESRKQKREYVKTHYSGEVKNGFFPFADGLSEITAQLEPVDLKLTFWAQHKVLMRHRPSPEKINTASQKELDEYLANEITAIGVLFLATANDDALSDFLGRLGKALPQLRANKRAPDVEKLFFSAAFAADSVATQNFKSRMNAITAQHRDPEIVRVWGNNPLLLESDYMANKAFFWHRMLLPESEKKPADIPYHTQGSLKAQVYALAFNSAVMVLYGPDNSSDFMSHMQRNARSAAIRNINDCVRSGIPCLPAICDFELAESASLSSKNAYLTLVLYWRASLYSKALLMSFKPEK